MHDTLQRYLHLERTSDCRNVCFPVHLIDETYATYTSPNAPKDYCSLFIFRPKLQIYRLLSVLLHDFAYRQFYSTDIRSPKGTSCKITTLYLRCCTFPYWHCRILNIHRYTVPILLVQAPSWEEWMYFFCVLLFYSSSTIVFSPASFIYFNATLLYIQI